MSRHLIASIVFTVIVVLGSSIGWWYYYDAELQALRQQQQHGFTTLQSAMEKQNKALIELGENLQEYIETKSSALEEQLGESITNVQSDLLRTKSETNQAFESITGRIVQVESESSAALTELEKRISRMQVSSQDFSALIPSIMPSVVVIRTDISSGSGFVIDAKDGKSYVVTNEHVVRNAESITVYTWDRETLSAQLLSSDATVDLAVLSVEAEANLPTLRFENRVELGERVIAIGSPGGLDFTVTEGIVSGVRDSSGVAYVQHDVPVNPGNSGGPLVNAQGRVIGVNTMKIKDLEGIGFSIATSSAEPVVQSAIP